MALTAASMKTKILAALAAAGITYDSGATVGGDKTVDQVITAFCQGIVNEITANGEVLQGNDDDGDIQVNGTIT